LIEAIALCDKIGAIMCGSRTCSWNFILFVFDLLLTVLFGRKMEALKQREGTAAMAVEMY